MNIVLKAFDDPYGKIIIENALRSRKIGTCISILNDKTQWPDLDAEEHLWLDAHTQREGRYPDTHWDEMMSVDEDLIEAMRPAEAVFLKMVERYAVYRELSYEERMQQYRMHLRFWNHMLRAKKIDLVLMNTVPHQCYDWVLYHLCKHLNIPVFYLARFAIMDAFSVESDWETVGKTIGERFAELKAADDVTHAPAHLSPYFESIFASFTKTDEDPWYMFRRGKNLERKSFVRKWAGVAVRIAVQKPAYFFNAVTSPSFWKRKWRQHRTAKMYDCFAQTPDLSLPYIYVPLHMQPEATTCPMGGAYADQELLVQVLASSLPDGVRLFVKEHPAQGELCRSKAFYEALHAIPSVTLVPRHYSTFALRDHALAVASVTGIACFEGLFREKPALMFGHQFFQYAPGIFRIRSAEECRQAVQVIMEKKKVHTQNDMRLFLKAIEETTKPYAGAHQNPLIPITGQEKAVEMGRVIAQVIAPCIPAA
ncbi:MAG: hypothetical protein V1926_04485 [Candidatus Peregrinibacteria bacterium]